MHRNATSGFTIIEMMIAVAIMAILLSLAVPSFRDSALNSRLRSASTSLISGATLARTEAIKRRAVVNMCVSSNGTSCTAGHWHQGWIIVVPSTGEVIRRYGAEPTGFRINASGSITAVAFQPTGVGATAVSFTACQATPTPGEQERRITIDATGRVSAYRTKTGTCS